MRVVVLGAGFAGLGSCAALAADGHQVVLLERRGLFGGRFACSRDAVTGDPVGAGPIPVSAGSTEFLGLLEALGLRDALHPPGTFDLPAAIEIAARGLAGPPPPPSDPGERLLAALCFGQPAAAIATADGRAEARRLLLRPAGDAVPLLWPRRPWGEIAEDAAARLAERGVTLRRRVLAEAIEVEAGKVVGVSCVQRPDSREEIRRGRRGEPSRIEADAVVATPGWRALAPLLPADARRAEFSRRAEALRPVASETLHLWYEEPWPGGFLQAVGDGLVAFAIDAGRLHGRAGALHQVTVAVDPAAADASRTPAEWVAAAAAALTGAAPAAGRALARAIALRDPGAAFEAAGERPAQRTPIRGLALAGDWTATGLPPSLEGAVASGRRAAALVSER